MKQIARLFDFIFDCIFPPKNTAKLVRDAPFETFGMLVAPSITEQGVHVLLPYRHPLVRATILEAKFNRNPKAIQFLGDVLRDYLDMLTEDSAAFETTEFRILPIPLGAGRQARRGYNQVGEIVKASGVVGTEDILIRTRDTSPQTSLSRAERLLNMDGAFEISGTLHPGYTYIVLDDVMTTGATLTAAVSAMKTSENVAIIPIALAH